VTNQGWSEERPHPKKRGMKSIEEINSISKNMELLMKKLDEQAKFKKDQEAIQQYASVHAIETNQWCKCKMQAMKSCTPLTMGELSKEG